MRSLRRVCVFCGSSSGVDPHHADDAAGLGTHLAARGIELVYGGGAVGLMGVVADATMAAGGQVTGVIPKDLFRREIDHRAITTIHHTSTMHERKALMYELADAFIALPGGLGTLEELFETLTWAQLGLHRKPVGLLDPRRYFDHLLSFLGATVTAGFVRPENVEMLVVDTTPAALLDRLATVELPGVDKWIQPEKI